MPDRRRRLGLEALEERSMLATVTLHPVADNSLFESPSGNLSNGAGDYLFAGLTQQGNNANQRRGLIKFNVAASIPPGAQIDSVVLRLNQSKANPTSGARDFGLHRVLADWGEGTSNAANEEGGGASATSNSATWLHRFFPSVQWTSAGGDFVSTPSAVTSVDAPGTYEWSSSQLAADVQSWLNAPSTQFGWMLKEVDETLLGTAKRFDSREISAQTLRPALVVNYTVASNQAPTLDAIGSLPAILEDAGLQTIGLSGISAGAGETQGLTISAVSSNPDLIPQPTVSYASPSSTGSISFRPADDQFGTATITVTVQDDGGTANGGVDTTVRQVTINVTAVNDPPEFVAGPDIALDGNSGAQVFSSWATGMFAGPANEAGQALEFFVTNNNNGLFAEQPQIDTSGALRFEPAPQSSGTAEVTVVLRDNGGVANGGTDSSAPQTFTISIARPNPWHNTLLTQDVNGDTVVTPLDSLLVLTYLNSVGAGMVPDDAADGPPFLDTSGDGEVTPLDSLLVITFLNSEGSSEGSAGRASTAAEVIFGELDAQAERQRKKAGESRLPLEAWAQFHIPPEADSLF